MAKNKQLEALVMAAEDGDVSASAALHDMAEEDGLPSFWKPTRGDWVVIFTGQYFHCGLLLGEDHECYGLAPGSAVIYTTGLLKDFYEKAKAGEVEICPFVCIVRKGPISQVVHWPHKKIPS